MGNMRLALMFFEGEWSELGDLSQLCDLSES
jgi:hypothetical protein